MPLPTTKTKPVTSLGAFKTLLYGPTKAGKTTLASHYPDAIFLSTEPGAQALSVYEAPIKTWADFLAAAHELAAGRHNFKTIVIDTIDLLWRYNEEAFLVSIGTKQMPDDYGRTSSRVSSEFHRELARLASLPYGLVMISHTSSVEEKTRTGTITKYTSSMATGCRRIVHGMTDLIFFLEVIPEVVAGQPTGKVIRQLRTKPSATYDAGDRTGKLSDPLPCSYDAIAADLRRALGIAMLEHATATPEEPPVLPPSLKPPEAEDNGKSFSEAIAEMAIPPAQLTAPVNPAQRRRR